MRSFDNGDLKKPYPFPNAADTLEELMYNICYFFAQATKAVNICPPAYYTDLVYEHARCYLSNVFDLASSSGSSVTSNSQVIIKATDIKIH